MIRSKYFNRNLAGYASTKEAKRAQELSLLQRMGKISNLQEQVSFEILPKQDGERAVRYVADFVYLDADGNRVVEDVKSEYTRKLPAYILKRKMLLFRFGIRIKEV